VRRGLAIFSLEGQGEARLVPLPAHPLAARWVTLKDYAFRQQTFSSKTNETTYPIVYEQDGLVWQAEEVREGGRWHRYYGFVGRRLARVPAEDVEFPSNWFQFGALSRRLECRVALDPTPAGAEPSFELRRPLMVTVRLRNRAGLAQSVPAEFVRDAPGGPAFRDGVVVKLYRATDDPSKTARPAHAWPGDRNFEELTPRPVARFNPGPAARDLGPAESFDAMRFDLASWFEIDRPGRYRLEVTFTPASEVAEGVSNPADFRVVKPADDPSR
jgi:hypothetical protein